MSDLSTIIKDSVRSGRIFRVTFVKANGEHRAMVCRGGVRKHLRGGQWANGKAGRPGDHGLVVVFDMIKRAYRSIALDRALSVRANGEEVAA